VKATVPVGDPEEAVTVAVYVTTWPLHVLQLMSLALEAIAVLVGVAGAAALTVWTIDAEDEPRVVPSV
jgi:hypothetical protein